MMRKILTLAILLFAINATAAEMPRLVVVIIFDQFRGDYLDRFQPYFAADGFNRFMKRGAYFTEAHHQHGITSTAPGFATIGTGLPPSIHGIVANEWHDRDLDRIEYSLADERTQPVGAAHGRSPVNMLEDSLGDRIIERYPQSKVIGVGLDDRTAIAPAGRRATAAYWWDYETDRLASSTYYRVNPTVLQFNDRIPALLQKHTQWDLSGFIPADHLDRVAFDPPELRTSKGNAEGLGVSFPHPITTVEAFIRTPFAIEMLFDFALHVITTERLGRDDSPDALYIGIDPTDHLGHSYGPDSYEIADTMVRADRALARFVGQLEKDFPGRVVVAISADHGVQRIPEVARAKGEKSERFDFRGPGRTTKTIGELSANRKRVEQELGRRLNYEVTDATPISNRMIREYTYSMLYLNWPRIRELKLDGERVKATLRDVVMEVPGVRAAFTNTELMRPNDAPSEVEKAMRLSFHAARSGDVIFTLHPGYVVSSSNSGTNHREAIRADQHVPLLLWGSGVRAGVYEGRVAPADLAKSLGVLLGVTAGATESKVLPGIEAGN